VTLTSAELGLLVAIAWFVVLAVLHAALHRYWRGGVGPLMAACIGAAAGLVTTIVMSTTETVYVALAFGLLAYACLVVLYVPFLYVIQTSISVRTLIVLLQHDGKLAQSELYQRFAAHAIMDGRLSTLRESGYVAFNHGRYWPTRWGESVARVFMALKELWRLGPGG
jgi:hypothetical protein